VIPARKKPVFGTIALALMLALFGAGILIVVFEPPLKPVAGDAGFVVAMGLVAEILATLLAAAVVSLSAAIFALVGFIRGEVRGPAAVGLCLSLSCLLVLVITIVNL
jgi:hypothetical protein